MQSSHFHIPKQLAPLLCQCLFTHLRNLLVNLSPHCQFFHRTVKGDRIDPRKVYHQPVVRVFLEGPDQLREGYLFQKIVGTVDEPFYVADKLFSVGIDIT